MESLTLIFWIVVEELPQISVAFQVRTMVNLLTQAPGVTTSLTVTETAPVQLSVADTLAGLAVGTAAAQVYTIAAGVPVITGAILSLTVIP